MPPLKNAEEIASHVLVFLIRGIVNPLKFVVANFATTNATAIQIFPLFWKAVGILEKTCVSPCYATIFVFESNIATREVMSILYLTTIH